MNFHWPFFSTPHPSTRELVETRSQNLFLQAKAEASAFVAAEAVGRCIALEHEVHLSRRPKREPRKDKGAVAEARARTTEALKRMQGRVG